MPRKSPPRMVEDAFELYLKYNGERFDLIEKEMNLKGWTFDKKCLKSRGKGINYRVGWIETYHWDKALEIYLACKGKDFLTSSDKLLHEVETIREQLFTAIKSNGVNNRDLVWQHEKYSKQSIEILTEIEKANNPLGSFDQFFSFLLTASLKISPTLARELVNAEDSILKLAKDEFSNKK